MARTVRIPIGKYDWIEALYETPDNPDPVLSNRTLVIMVHGYPDGHKSGNNDLFGDLEYQLTQDRLDTIRFDFMGCGESNGEIENFTFESARRDFLAVLQWAEQKSYRSLVVIAEGFGNCIALMDLHKHLKCFVMLWPMLDPKNSWMGQYIEQAKSEKVKDGFVMVGDTKVGKVFLDQLDNCNMKKSISNINVPVLIQHGSKDQNIPIDHLDLMRDHIRSSKRVDITSYETGGHGLQKLNERETMFYHIRQFLQKYT